MTAIEGIIGNRLAEIAAQTQSTAIPSTQNVADNAVLQDGVTQFNEVLLNNVTYSDPMKTQGTAITSNVTPGEGIVQSIQSVRDKFLEIENNVRMLAQKGTDFSSADLFQMQYDVMQLTYLNELSSKTADKTSQGIQTLFRNQG